MVLVLVDVKMKNKFLVSLNNLEEIEIYKKEGINSFLLPLKDYTVGYPNTYSVSKIKAGNAAQVLSSHDKPLTKDTIQRIQKYIDSNF